MNQKDYMLLGGGLLLGWYAGWWYAKRPAAAGQLYAVSGDTSARRNVRGDIGRSAQTANARTRSTQSIAGFHGDDLRTSFHGDDVRGITGQAVRSSVTLPGYRLTQPLNALK